jgi:hypothetical protein
MFPVTNICVNMCVKFANDGTHCSFETISCSIACTEIIFFPNDSDTVLAIFYFGIHFTSFIN